MNNQEPKTTTTEISKYDQIPADFPMTALLGAISGAQAKLLLTEYEGKFYSPGTSPPERLQRWDICEDLARQFTTMSCSLDESFNSRVGNRFPGSQDCRCLYHLSGQS